MGKRFLQLIQNYPTKIITIILGVHLFVAASYNLVPGTGYSSRATMSFGLGGDAFYSIYLISCCLVGLTIALSAVFNKYRLVKFSLLLFFGLRLYIVIVTIVSLGFFPMVWLPNLILALIALTIRISLRMREVDNE